MHDIVSHRLDPECHHHRRRHLFRVYCDPPPADGIRRRPGTHEVGGPKAIDPVEGSYDRAGVHDRTCDN